MVTTASPSQSSRAPSTTAHPTPAEIIRSPGSGYAPREVVAGLVEVGSGPPPGTCQLVGVGFDQETRKGGRTAVTKTVTEPSVDAGALDLEQLVEEGLLAAAVA